MIYLEPDIKVYIYQERVDMRKSIDGLAYLVSEEIKLDPQSKSLFLFYNKAKDKFKAIVWDKNGFVLVYKRMEKGKFKFPKLVNNTYYEIDADLFNWLRKGFDFYALKQHPELKTSAYY